MKLINPKSLLQKLHAAMDRAQRRFRQARPGSVLILVVALLTLLALMGTAYLSTTRLDRIGVQQLQKDADLQQSADSLAVSMEEKLKSWIVNNTADLVTGLIVDPNHPAHQTGMFVGDRAPQLLPNAPQPTPAWRHLTNWPNFTGTASPLAYSPQKFESPYGGSSSTPLTYDFSDDKQWAVPSYVIVNYTNPTSANYKQTWTYPALTLINPSGGAGTYSTLYLAADTRGMGIADAPLVRLSTTVGDVIFYGAATVVDNASGVNVNTAWSPTVDVDSSGNPTLFFPPAIDLLGMMYNPGGGVGTTEMQALNNQRYHNIDTAGPLTPHDDFSPRGDVKYLNNSEAMWMQVGRRLNYPNIVMNAPVTTPYIAGDPNVKNGRPFSDQDSAALYLRGGLLPSQSALSKLDAAFKKLGKQPTFYDSIYQGAANYFTNKANNFTSFAATDVLYWYDWYWNFEAKPMQMLTPPGDIAAKMGKTYSGMDFRTPRGLLVPANPISNQCFFVDYNSLPSNVKGSSSAGTSPETIGDPNRASFPHKTGLNTADFPELWRAFVNVMADETQDSNNKQPTQFGKIPGLSVPGDPSFGGAGANKNAQQFRNPIRAGGSGGSSKSTGGTCPNNGNSVVLDSQNVLLLRAALAAANVETLRNNQGTMNGTLWMPDIARHTVALKTNGASVNAVVYGVGVQPYIAEVYCDNDGTDHDDGKGNTINNVNGLIAIKLYNPYQQTLDLSGYSAVGLNRSANPMSVTKIDFSTATGTKTIGPDDYLVLTNYDPKAAGGGAVAPAQYWPKTMPLPTNTMVVPELGKLLSGGATGTTSALEFVLLRPISAGSTNPKDAEAPVDSFDFTGLKDIVKGPIGGGSTATYWHYTRDVHGGKVDKWGFVWPGDYDPTKTERRLNADGVTRIDSTDYDPDETKGMPPTWAPYELNSGTGGTTTGKTQNPYKYGIQLCNADMGGFNKPGGATRTFPYGGFARVGDVLQAPFIGSYIMLSGASGPAGTNVGTPPAWDFAGTISGGVVEINPVTMDCIYADDGDQADDKVEHVGRFVALREPNVATPSYDDYNPYGKYQYGLATGITVPSWGTATNWHYHWANKVFEQFTVVTNPADDYFPNFNPNNYKGTKPTVTFQSKASLTKQNNIATTRPNTTIYDEGIEDSQPVEGLININTAPWRVLAAVEFVPKSKDDAAHSLNTKIAQGIVYFRDVDDGTGKNHGHGPFSSLAELNAVWDVKGGSQTTNFANAWGTLPAGTLPDATWGNFVPYTNNTSAKANMPADDWLSTNLMVARVSNLLTVRSDSFTVYVVVQGWRNVNTTQPELVVQKRLAATIDRSGIITYAPPASAQSPVVHTVPTR